LWASNADGMFGCSALGGTEAVITNDDGVPAGIISGHAYSIINVIEIDGERLKEIKLYNPADGSEYDTTGTALIEDGANEGKV